MPVAVLSDAVKQSSDPSLRLAALKGLGKIGNRDAMPPRWDRLPMTGR
jgi:hypothetical protein